MAADDDDPREGMIADVDLTKWKIRPPRNDPNRFPGQNEHLYIARITLLLLFSFMVGWGSEYSFHRYEAFVSMLTGNLFLAARNTVIQRLWSGVPMFYICVIASNLVGAYSFAVLRVFTPYAATAITPIVVFLLILGDILWHVHFKSKWLACTLAPIFGAVNVMISYGPVGVTPTFATASLQRIAQFPAKRIAGPLRKRDYAEVLLLFAAVFGLSMGVLFSDIVLDWDENGETIWNEVLMGIMFFILLPLHDFLFYHVLIDYLPADALPPEHLRHRVFRWCGQTEESDSDEASSDDAEE